MSKIIIKKEDEILTLLDEKEIETKAQRTRICYMYLREMNKAILHHNLNRDDMTNMDPLKDDDVVLFSADYISDYSGPLYYADGTTVINYNFSYVGSASNNSSIGILFKQGTSWESAVIYGKLSSSEVVNLGALPNLGLSTGAKQNTINSRINARFGDVLSIINGTNYNGGNNGE